MLRGVPFLPRHAICNQYHQFPYYYTIPVISCCNKYPSGHSGWNLNLSLIHELRDGTVVSVFQLRHQAPCTHSLGHTHCMASPTRTRFGGPFWWLCHLWALTAHSPSASLVFLISLWSHMFSSYGHAGYKVPRYTILHLTSAFVLLPGLPFGDCHSFGSWSPDNDRSFEMDVHRESLRVNSRILSSLKCDII